MTLAAILGAVVGLLAGGGGGFLLGRWLRCRPRVLYWFFSASFILVGVVVIFLGQISRLPFVSGAGLGLLTGGVNGVKYGAGKLREWRGQGCENPLERE